MVIAELKKLFIDKEYRIYLILVILLILGFTLFQFTPTIPYVIPIIIFIFLIGISITFFIATLIFQIDLKKTSLKRIIILFLIGGVVTFVLFVILFFIYQVFYVAALISYIIITAIFYIYGCYNYAINIDKELSKLKNPKILRIITFLGGTLLALIIVFILIQITMVAMYIMVIMIILAIIGVITLLKGKLNSWLGIFFLWVALYSIYLIMSIIFALNPSDEASNEIWVIVGLYFLDLFVLIYVITTIIGKKTEVLTEKLKYIKPDAILIWLILSKAAFEFGKYMIDAPTIRDTMDVVTFNAILSYLIFIPLFALVGIYGIIKYSKNRES